MPTPHKHAEFIKAWADGAEIQIKTLAGRWVTIGHVAPSWEVKHEYRIKPEPQVYECFIHKEAGRVIYENPYLLQDYKRCTITIHPDE